MLTKPDEIDFNVGLMGDFERCNAEDFSAYERNVNSQGSMLVTIYDCEGEPICVAPLEIANWLIELMNGVRPVEREVIEAAKAYTKTSLEQSRIELLATVYRLVQAEGEQK